MNVKLFIRQNLNELHLCRDFKETIWVLLSWIFSLISVMSIQYSKSMENSGVQSVLLIFSISVLSSVYPKMSQSKRPIPKIIYFLFFLNFLFVFSICFASLFGIDISSSVWKKVYLLCYIYVGFIVLDFFLIFFFPISEFSDILENNKCENDAVKRKRQFLNALNMKEETND